MSEEHLEPDQAKQEAEKLVKKLEQLNKDDLLSLKEYSEGLEAFRELVDLVEIDL